MDAQGWEETHFERKPLWLNFKDGSWSNTWKSINIGHDPWVLYVDLNVDSNVVLYYSLERETLILV